MALGVLSAGSATAQTASTPKVGFIYSRQVMQQTPGYQAAESTFNRELETYQNEVQKMQHQFDSSVQAFDQQSIALSPAAKAAKQKELQEQGKRMEQRQSELQQKAQQRNQELMQPLQARIKAVIDGMRAEGNYALIFDADAPGGAIVAVDPALDLTSKVLQRLKQSQ
jgi:outer membrane protein